MPDSKTSNFRTLLEAKRDDLLHTYASGEEIATQTGEKRSNVIPRVQYCVKRQELIDRECTLDDSGADGLGFAA